jgi:hypothetical protein
MSNKKKPQQSNTAGQPDVQLVVDKVIYDLLQQRKINQLLTWKDMEGKKPMLISVSTAQQDDPILVKCTLMDIVGFGYRPKNYPLQFAADRKSTRFHVEFLDQNQVTETEKPAEETETEQ